MNKNILANFYNSTMNYKGFLEKREPKENFKAEILKADNYKAQNFTINKAKQQEIDNDPEIDVQESEEELAKAPNEVIEENIEENDDDEIMEDDDDKIMEDDKEEIMEDGNEEIMEDDKEEIMEDGNEENMDKDENLESNTEGSGLVNKVMTYIKGSTAVKALFGVLIMIFFGWLYVKNGLFNSKLTYLSLLMIVIVVVIISISLINIPKPRINFLKNLVKNDSKIIHTEDEKKRYEGLIDIKRL